MWTTIMNFVGFLLVALLPIVVSGYHEVTVDTTEGWTTDDGLTTEETLIGRVIFTLITRVLVLLSKVCLL